MKKMFVLMAVLAILAAPAFAQINVLNNGNFETGDYSGWTAWNSSWADSFSISVVDDTNDPVYSGYSLKLDATNGSFGIYQEINSVAGQEYTINGMFSGTGQLDWVEVLMFNDDGRTINKQADEEPLASSIIAKVDGWGQNGGPNFGWSSITDKYATAGLHTNTITATGSKIYVVLKGGTSNSNGPGCNVKAYFDDFTVTTTPEPSSLLALASGIGALGFGLRRKIR